MSRIAVAVWRGHVATTLDFASRLLLVDVQGGGIGAPTEIRLGGPAQRDIASRLEQLQVSTVICGAISRCLLRNVEARRIQVIPFVRGEAEKVLRAFVNRTLDDSRVLMAGCPPGTRRARRGRHGEDESGRARR